MNYITIFGKLNGEYIISNGKLYCLDKDYHKIAWGFAVLEKTYRGFYNFIKFKSLDFMSEPGEFIELRDKLMGKKQEARTSSLPISTNSF